MDHSRGRTRALSLLGENEGMTERWLTWLGGAGDVSPGRTGSPARFPARIAGAALTLAAVGQALGQAVTIGYLRYAQSPDPDHALFVFLYAVALCALALLSTVPLLLAPPAWAAVLAVAGTVLALAWFLTPTVAGAVAAVCAVWRLGAAGPPGKARNGGLMGVAAEYLAVWLALPFLVLALVRRGDVPYVLLAWAVPVAAGAGIAVRARRTARTYSEAGEALADTLVAHTARGERARIARELHDVVAHHISMVAVLAETGRLATPGLPEAGARRFLEIGDTARAGLTEMRRLLGVLREDAAGTEPERPAAPPPSDASRQPQPGLAQLTELIDAAREASLAGTRLIISGPVTPLDSGVELAAYRIVQEALTNARRHAPGAAVDVELRYGPQVLRVRVRDNGPGPVTAPEAAGLAAEVPGQQPPGSHSGEERRAGRQAGGGHGLLGMRERAFSVGGALYVGAAPGGGFLVEAVLPSEPDLVRASLAGASASTAATAGRASGTGGDR